MQLVNVLCYSGGGGGGGGGGGRMEGNPLGQFINSLDIKANHCR